MDPFSMVVAIVAMAIGGNILREWVKGRNAAPAQIDEAQNKALIEEVSMLRDRVKVLERIAVEKNDSLTQQIEELRDR